MFWSISGQTLCLSAILASEVIGHPLFNGKVISRAQDLLPEYDYVVVGGGASGLTVANRLSEQPNVQVLVIEAGDFDQNEDFVTIPGLAGGAIGTKYDWNTTYAATERLGGRVTKIPQGKVVGGSTKLNRMVFDRGSKSDYDGWETLGNDGWGFKDLLPYLKKNEKFTPATSEIQAEFGMKDDLQYHGSTGYMQVTYSRFFWPLTKNLIKATKALGIPINDQATGNSIGGYFCPKNQDPVAVARSSAKEAYYASAVQRENYHLLAGNQVTRIIISSTSEIAKVTGIEFAASADAKRQTVDVRQEAVLAAGALHTPQLLQVSGVGDVKLLSAIDVPTIVDLPAVGHNLHDHVSVTVVNAITTTLPVTSWLMSNATFAAEARKQYDTEREGPLTSPTGDFLLFLPLSTYSNASASIAAQAAAGEASASLPSDTPAIVAHGYEAQYASLNKKLVSKDAAFLEIIFVDGTMVLGLQHPYSRGSVKAASSNVFDAPVADVGFLRNPLDVALIREGVRWARLFTKADGIAELTPIEGVPGDNVTSDTDIDSFIRGSAATLYHPAGSCKMGARQDGGVVDRELKVYGVEGLRIVDASIMPILPASHIMTTVYAVAEKAADIIRKSPACMENCKA